MSTCTPSRAFVISASVTSREALSNSSMKNSSSIDAVAD